MLNGVLQRYYIGIGRVLRGTQGHWRVSLGVLSAYFRRTRLKHDGIRRRDALLCGRRAAQPCADPIAEHFNADVILKYADVSRRCAPLTPRAISPIPHPFLPFAPHILYSVRGMALPGPCRLFGALTWAQRPPRGHVYCHGTRVQPFARVRVCGPSLHGGAPAHGVLHGAGGRKAPAEHRAGTRGYSCSTARVTGVHWLRRHGRGPDVLRRRVQARTRPVPSAATSARRAPRGSRTRTRAAPPLPLWARLCFRVSW